MSGTNDNTMDFYYQNIITTGHLLSDVHARRWSEGVLKTLGTSLDRRTKRALAKALPKGLAESLTSVFWLLHFRDPNQTRSEFCTRVARRSGNSNGEFAVYPTLAVFAGLKNLIDDNLTERVSNSLSPEVRDLWDQAL